MASYSNVRISTNTLTADTTDDVTLSSGAGKAVELVHHGDADTPIFFWTNSADELNSEREVLLPSERLSFSLGSTGTLKIESTGAATYTVVVTGS